jgi:hypothetical protein
MTAASDVDLRTPNAWPMSAADRHEAVRRRAEEIYVRSGRIPGRDLENWAQAEQEVLRESEARPASRKAIAVRVDGVQYIGEYNLETSDGYRPGEFGTGVAVPVRFHGNKMFVRRPNGKELETTIVQKIE